MTSTRLTPEYIKGAAADNHRPCPVEKWRERFESALDVAPPAASNLRGSDKTPGNP
jgi:hypothetical protein